MDLDDSPKFDYGPRPEGMSRVQWKNHRRRIKLRADATSYQNTPAAAALQPASNRSEAPAMSNSVNQQMEVVDSDHQRVEKSASIADNTVPRAQIEVWDHPNGASNLGKPRPNTPQSIAGNYPAEREGVTKNILANPASDLNSADSFEAPYEIIGSPNSSKADPALANKYSSAIGYLSEFLSQSNMPSSFKEMAQVPGSQSIPGHQRVPSAEHDKTIDSLMAERDEYADRLRIAEEKFASFSESLDRGELVDLQRQLENAEDDLEEEQRKSREFQAQVGIFQRDAEQAEEALATLENNLDKAQRDLRVAKKKLDRYENYISTNSDSQTEELVSFEPGPDQHEDDKFCAQLMGINTTLQQAHESLQSVGITLDTDESTTPQEFIVKLCHELTAVYNGASLLRVSLDSKQSIIDNQAIETSQLQNAFNSEIQRRETALNSVQLKQSEQTATIARLLQDQKDLESFKEENSNLRSKLRDEENSHKATKDLLAQEKSSPETTMTELANEREEHAKTNRILNKAIKHLAIAQEKSKKALGDMATEHEAVIDDLKDTSRKATKEHETTIQNLKNEIKILEKSIKKDSAAHEDKVTELKDTHAESIQALKRELIDLDTTTKNEKKTLQDRVSDIEKKWTSPQEMDVILTRDAQLRASYHRVICDHESVIYENGVLQNRLNGKFNPIMVSNGTQCSSDEIGPTKSDLTVALVGQPTSATEDELEDELAERTTQLSQLEATIKRKGAALLSIEKKFDETVERIVTIEWEERQKVRKLNRVTQRQADEKATDIFRNWMIEKGMMTSLQAKKMNLPFLLAQQKAWEIEQSKKVDEFRQRVEEIERNAVETRTSAGNEFSVAAENMEKVSMDESPPGPMAAETNVEEMETYVLEPEVVEGETEMVLDHYTHKSQDHGSSSVTRALQILTILLVFVPVFVWLLFPSDDFCNLAPYSSYEYEKFMDCHQGTSDLVREAWYIIVDRWISWIWRDTIPGYILRGFAKAIFTLSCIVLIICFI